MNRVKSQPGLFSTYLLDLCLCFCHGLLACGYLHMAPAGAIFGVSVKIIIESLFFEEKTATFEIDLRHRAV